MQDIHVGDSIGHYYDNVRRTLLQVIYKMKNNLLFHRDSEMFDGIYEIYPEFLPFPGQHVVDVGCQFADYSILCNKMYGANVTAFEPLLNNYMKALKSIEKNKAKVTLFNVGLSNREFQATMESDNNMLSVKASGSNKELISFQTLDHFELKPDILKIDVEGFEMDVLEGAVKTIVKYKPRIIIETHSTELEKKVKDFLGNLNYGLPKEGRRTHGSGVVDWMDSVVNLFFKPE